MNSLPCTSVVIRNDMVIGAFVSGKIIVLGTQTNAKLVEINAHSQVINSLALHPLKDTVRKLARDRLSRTNKLQFVSVSDDTVIQVWSIINDKTKEVSYFHKNNYMIYIFL